MDRRWLLWTAVLLAGCTREQSVQAPPDSPKQVKKDFAQLTSILDGIHRSGEIALYEGLPSEFWEPQLREREASQKKTISINGYLFYDKRLAPRGPDLEQFTRLFSDARSFRRYQSTKVCGGYHPDYCIEWKKGDVTTRALICLECGEVQFFAPPKELYCDLSPEAGRDLARRLSSYQENRPAAPSQE